jgi:hypothetical protein
MKTICVSSTWLDGIDKNGDEYLHRLGKYLAFYRPLKNVLGIDEFLFVDNGSQHTNPLLLPAANDYRITSLQPNLKRGEHFDYPYVWRYYFYLSNLFIYYAYDKILIIEDDTFILSQRLADYVREKKTGWTAMWCPRYEFPECNLQILCRDSFGVYEEFTRGNFMKMNGKCFETTAPFTHVEKGFHGNRWGEERIEPAQDADYYCQTPLDMTLRFSPSSS